jgi:hypothetical protein
VSDVISNENTRGHTYETVTEAINTDTTAIENARPFRIERVVREGRSVAGVPAVVKCKWTPINTTNLLAFEGTLEDARSIKSCNFHDYYRGHLCMHNGVYLIPYGFAVGGELTSSDGSILNQAVISGDKNGDDVATYCYERIKGKRGILRKSCNGCRPVNTFRLVASPRKLESGWMEIPRRVMERGKFMYIS